MPVRFSLSGCRTFEDLRAHFSNEWEKKNNQQDFVFIPRNKEVSDAHDKMVRNIPKKYIPE